MTTRTQQIAKTISQQIPTMDKMAIGYRNPSSMSETENRLGGLNFDVNRGRRAVSVELTPADTYRVRYYRVKITKTNIEQVTLAEIDNVYCDCLGATIYSMTQATDDFNARNGDLFN